MLEITVLTILLPLLASFQPFTSAEYRTSDAYIHLGSLSGSGKNYYYNSTNSMSNFAFEINRTYTGLPAFVKLNGKPYTLQPQMDWYTTVFNEYGRADLGPVQDSYQPKNPSRNSGSVIVNLLRNASDFSIIQSIWDTEYMRYSTLFGFWSNKPYIWIYNKAEVKSSFVCINCQHCNMWNAYFNQWVYLDYTGSVINRTETDPLGSPTQWQDRFPVFAQMDTNSSLRTFPFISHYNSTMNITVGQIMTYASPNVRSGLEYELFDYRAPVTANNGWIEDQLNIGGDDSVLAQQWIAGTRMEIEYLLFMKIGSPTSSGNIRDHAKWLFNNATSIREPISNELYSASYSRREWGIYTKRLISAWTPWTAIGGSESRAHVIGDDWLGEQRSFYIPFLEQNDSMHALPDPRSRLPIFYRFNISANWMDGFEAETNFWNSTMIEEGSLSISTKDSYEGIRSLEVKTFSQFDEASFFRGGVSTPFIFPSSYPYNISVRFKIIFNGTAGFYPRLTIIEVGEDSLSLSASMWRISFEEKVEEHFWGLDLARHGYDAVNDFYNFSVSPLGEWQKVSVMVLNATAIRIFVNDHQIMPDFLVHSNDINYLGNIGVKDLIATVYYDNFEIDASAASPEYSFQSEGTRINPTIDIYNYSATSPTPIERKGSLAVINGLTGDGIPAITTMLTAQVWNNSDKILFTGNLTLNTGTKIKNITLNLMRNSFGVNIVEITSGEYDVRWKDRLRGWVGIYIKNNHKTSSAILDNGDRIGIILINNTVLTSYSKNQAFSFNITIWGHEGNESSLSEFFTTPATTYKQVNWILEQDEVSSLRYWALKDYTPNLEIPNSVLAILILLTAGSVVLAALLLLLRMKWQLKVT